MVTLFYAPIRYYNTAGLLCGCSHCLSQPGITRPDCLYFLFYPLRVTILPDRCRCTQWAV